MNIRSPIIAFAVSLILSLATAMAVASDGGPTGPIAPVAPVGPAGPTGPTGASGASGLAGHWVSVNANSGAAQDLQIGTHSIRLDIQPDGNLDMITKTKRDGQQQFDTTHGRIDGDRLLFDSGRSATINPHGSMLELIDAGTPGRTVLFQRQ